MTGDGQTPRIIGAWIVALVAFVGFVLSSRRHAEPVIDPALLRIRTFSSANIAMLLFSIPFAGALLANILWLQQVWGGFSAIATGLAVSTGPLMVPIFAAVADRLSSRVPVGVIVAAGCVLFAVGIAMVALSVDATPRISRPRCYRAGSSAASAWDSRCRRSCLPRPPICLHIRRPPVVRSST